MTARPAVSVLYPLQPTHGDEMVPFAHLVQMRYRPSLLSMVLHAGVRTGNQMECLLRSPSLQPRRSMAAIVSTGSDHDRTAGIAPIQQPLHSLQTTTIFLLLCLLRREVDLVHLEAEVNTHRAEACQVAAGSAEGRLPQVI